MPPALCVASKDGQPMGAETSHALCTYIMRLERKESAMILPPSTGECSLTLLAEQDLNLSMP
jgi:hypothetical protein